MSLVETKSVTFTYTNYRGETSIRWVLPLYVHFGSNGYHPEPQWLLQGLDLDKHEQRSFAMKDIRNWNAENQDDG